MRDLAKSAAFYESVLGLQRIPDPFKDDRHVFLRLGAAELHLIAGASGSSTHDIDVHMAFSVPSVDEFVARLNRSGIRWVSSKREEGQVTVRPDGVRQVYFQDPDGFWLEVNDVKRTR